MLWTKPIYLILLSNYIYESENTEIIKAFVTSQKTKSLFNYISLEEKKRFIQYTITSLEKFIVDEE